MLRTRGKPGLRRYVAGVAVTWAVVLAGSWLVGGPSRFHTFVLVCSGYFIGMLSMYLAVRVHSGG
jgi:hypothetical protein